MPIQNPITIRRDDWSFLKQQYPEVWDFITNEKLSRTEIISQFSNIMKMEEILCLFIVSMIWGNGTNGYGSWWVRKMLESIDVIDFDFSLVQQFFSKGNILRAYEYFIEHHISFCGSAYFTKFLYFLLKFSSTKAPRVAYILDSKIAKSVIHYSNGLDVLTQLPIDDAGSVFSDAQRYLNYLDFIDAIVDYFSQNGYSQIRGDDIELMLFLQR